MSKASAATTDVRSVKSGSSGPVGGGPLGSGLADELQAARARVADAAAPPSSTCRRLMAGFTEPSCHGGTIGFALDEDAPLFAKAIFKNYQTSESRRPTWLQPLNH